MKEIINFRNALAILITVAISASMANGQMSQHKFNQMFAQAFEEVLVGKYEAALPMLEKLHQADPAHAQTAYLLGLSYVKQGGHTNKAVEVLQLASGRYDAAHQHGRVEDSTAPASVWMVLGDALSAAGRNKEAVMAYRTYMTTIPMASIQRKSEVISKIRMAKQADAPALYADNGANDRPSSIVQ
jgi:predicted Zn-dependent protease